MKLHFFVEGPSEEDFVLAWARRLLQGHAIRVYPHQGKGSLSGSTGSTDRRRRGLLDQLPSKLRAFADADPRHERIVVLVDADDDDCVELKQRIASTAGEACPSARVLVRVAVEELEAFYFGDLRALARAFPNADMTRARAFVPDSVVGTWEEFAAVIGGGGDKRGWAKAMGATMTTHPARSRSPSFRALCGGLQELVADERTRGEPRARGRERVRRAQPGALRGQKLRRHRP